MVFGGAKGGSEGGGCRNPESIKGKRVGVPRLKPVSNEKLQACRDVNSLKTRSSQAGTPSPPSG